MDATHDTNREGANLFSLVVRLPCGSYHWVAFVISALSTSDTLTRALHCIAERVPNWHPRAFMLDCDRAERNAVLEVFPWVFVSFCVFHVKQAWHRALGAKLGRDTPIYTRVLALLNALLHCQHPVTDADEATFLASLVLVMCEAGLTQVKLQWVMSYVKLWLSCKVTHSHKLVLCLSHVLACIHNLMVLTFFPLWLVRYIG